MLNLWGKKGRGASPPPPLKSANCNCADDNDSDEMKWVREGRERDSKFYFYFAFCFSFDLGNWKSFLTWDLKSVCSWFFFYNKIGISKPTFILLELTGIN